MRRARVELHGADRAIEGDCEVRNGVLSCRIEVRINTGTEFEERDGDVVPIPQVERRFESRSWPMTRVKEITWLEQAAA